MTQKPPPTTLDALLMPLSAATFVRSYWGQRPLLLKGRQAWLKQMLGGFIDSDTFLGSARAAAQANLPGFILSAGRQHGPFWRLGTEPKGFPRILPDQIESRLASGDSILAEQLAHPGLARLAMALKAALNIAGAVALGGTLSPPGAGVSAHFDRPHVLFLQFEGKKRWLLSKRPLTPWPRGTAGIYEDGSVRYYPEMDQGETVAPFDTREVTEEIMEPGDMLFVPPGTLHSTEAIEGSSLTMSIIFVESGAFSILSRLLAQILEQDPAWRHMPAVLTRPGASPALIRRFLAARLVEAKAALSALSPEGIELCAGWRQAVASPGDGMLSWLPPPAVPDRAISRRDVLRITSRVPITYALGGGTREMRVFAGDEEFSVSPVWGPFMRRVLAAERFRAGSALAWAPGRHRVWEAVKEQLQALAEGGILERA